MTCKAAVAIRIPGSLTLDERDDLVEKVRETAFPVLSDRTLLVEWEAPDLWQLRGLVESTVAETEGIWTVEDLFPDREPAGDGSGTNLATFQWWVVP